MEKPRLKKFHRELSRVTSKAAETLAEPFRMIYFLPLYDIKKNRQTRTTAGNISLMSEAGIYLVFPKDGILLSHLTMLRTMVRQGVSPVVVSNLPLSDADRDLLTKEAYRVIERPNIGYDFGGYRDSILSIEYLMPKLNRLWVLNDSAWLMDETGHWFVQARDLKVDFAGSVSNYGIKTVDIKNHDKIEWKYNEGNKDFHYTSNSWCIGSRVLSHPDFIRFWRRLQIRNSKKFTVNRGEIGFSQWVIRKGFTHDATLKLRDLRKNLESLSEIELDDVTRHLLMSRKSLEKYKTQVLSLDPNSENGRSARITLCLATVATFGFAISLPYYLYKYDKLPFLKKSIFTASQESVRLAFEILEKTSVPKRQAIIREAKLVVKH